MTWEWVVLVLGVWVPFMAVLFAAMLVSVSKQSKDTVVAALVERLKAKGL